MAQPYSDKPPGTASEPHMAGDDRDGDPEVDVVQASGREVEAESSTFDHSSSHRRNSSNDLKHRLEQWGESHLQPADSDEEGSEYELLLDPNLPEEYARTGVPTTRVTSNSTTSDEEKVMLVNEEGEEDSPYPEVRAAVRNFDIEAPCNTVSRINFEHTEPCADRVTRCVLGL